MQPVLMLAESTAALSRRYDVVKKGERKHGMVEPNRTSTGRPPNGWRKYTHPEGSPYFFHPKRRLVVEVNLEEACLVETVEAWWTHFQEQVQALKVTLPESTEIFLGPEDSENDQRFTYYLIDRKTQRQHWLRTTRTAELGMEMSMSQDHLERQLHEHFWIHLEFFPLHSPLPEGAEQEIVDLLGQAAVDQMTSNQSTAPFSASECKDFLMILNNMATGGQKNWIVARLRRVFAHSQFINRYGEYGARLARDQSILIESGDSPQLFTRILKAMYCLALFNTPQIHLSSLESLWVDRVVYGEQWNVFMKNLREEWSQAAQLSIAFVTFDLLFLILTTDSQHRPMLIHAIYISLLCGISSIVLANVYLRRHRLSLEAPYDAATAGLYLENWEHSFAGLQPLAVVYALPYAGSLWAVTLFMASLCIYASANNPSYEVI